jgi:hypothetical protein
MQMVLGRLFLLIIVGISLQGYCQTQNTYKLKGFVGIQGGESFIYELHLSDSLGDFLRGKATTSMEDAPNNYVQANVVAKLDKDKRTLYILEKEITANSGFRSRAIICLVESNLVFEESEGKLSGPLATHTSGNGASCAKGTITFLNKEEINPLFYKTTQQQKEEPKQEPIVQKPKIDPSKPAKIIYDTLQKAAPFVPKKLVEDITEGTDKTFIWKTDTVVLELWDGNTVDGDKVTIQYNGTDVLKDFMLSATRKKIALPIGGNELNIITIIAGSEGSEPPNTANLLLHDGDIEYPVVAHNKFGKRAVIKIKRKL